MLVVAAAVLAAWRCSGAALVASPSRYGRSMRVAMRGHSQPSFGVVTEELAVAEAEAEVQDYGDDADAVATGSMEIAFGKHRGKTYEEVYTSEKGYCVWAVSTVEASGDADGPLADFAAYVKSQDPSILDDMDHTMAIGKYKGYHYEEILSEDPEYFQFVQRVVEEDPDEASLPFLKCAGWLREHAPDLDTLVASKEASSTTVSFGKHRGKDFEEVFRKDLPYCMWVAKTKDLQKTAFAAYIHQQLSQMDLKALDKYADLRRPPSASTAWRRPA